MPCIPVTLKTAEQVALHSLPTVSLLTSVHVRCSVSILDTE